MTTTSPEQTPCIAGRTRMEPRAETTQPSALGNRAWANYRQAAVIPLPAGPPRRQKHNWRIEMSVSRLRILGLMISSSWLLVGCNSAKKIDVGGACILNSDCNSPLVCSAGKCHDACHTSADCLPGQSCIIASDQSTVCQLPVETHCAYNSDCPTGLICAADLKCRNQCQANVDCSTGQICTTTRTCAEPSQVDSNNNLIGPDGGVAGCPVGAETCSCYGNDTCNTGLTCASQLCVNLGVGGAGDAAAGGTGGTTTPDAGSNGGCQLGPGGFCWQTWTNATWSSPAPSASWVVPPSPDLVHVAARSGVDAFAGMEAQIPGGAAGMDLGQYDQLWFDAEVPQNQNFTVGVATDTASCYWYLVGTGKNRYTIDLKAANGCVPTACGYDRSKSRFLSFITKDWGASNTIDIALTAVGFSAVTSGFGPTTIGGSAGIGPGGWCASLFSWGSGGMAAAAWVGAPTTTQARVEVTDANTAGTAGLMIELPADKQDLSGVAYVDIDANVALSPMGQFEIVLTSSNAGACHYHPTAFAGATTYSLSMASPTECYTGLGHTFTPSSVANVTIGTIWDFTGTADITVTRIATR